MLAVTVLVLVSAAGFGVMWGSQDSRTITGPYAALLSASADLGPAQGESVQLTAALRAGSAPDNLTQWARQRGLAIRWRAGDRWAVIDGAPQAVATAFDVEVRDYRTRRGQLFYASPQQPQIPAALRSEVRELGRILSYTPFHDAQRWMFPTDVPDGALSPEALLRTYEVEPLSKAGFTGKGQTVVVFAFDGVDQPDLDMFTSTFALPPLRPEIVGGMASQRSGEATMDLEAIHAIAPDAKTVLVNARPTVEGGGAYQKIAAMLEDAERRYPGAVWSFSIGWGCDKLITAADLEPVRAALVAAHKSGTTSFNASGDLAGLECQGGEDWSTPPGPDEVGLDAVASLPEMTDVGGTSLSTDAEGNWIAEQAWYDVPILHGTGGGVSSLFERPPWQEQLDVGKGEGRRLTPDVSAVADPETGVGFVFQQRIFAGGGTSLSAPLWAGMAAILNQYLQQNGGRPVGDINPLLYEVAQGSRLPGFRPVSQGANAVDRSTPDYDLVTGLGTPRLANLAQDILAIQKSWIGVN
ncbi:MAG: S53 family peptidase [Mycobacterium sp.]